MRPVECCGKLVLLFFWSTVRRWVKSEACRSSIITVDLYASRWSEKLIAIPVDLAVSISSFSISNYWRRAGLAADFFGKFMVAVFYLTMLLDFFRTSGDEFLLPSALLSLSFLAGEDFSFYKPVLNRYICVACCTRGDWESSDSFSSLSAFFVSVRFGTGAIAPDISV